MRTVSRFTSFIFVVACLSGLAAFAETAGGPGVSDKKDVAAAKLTAAAIARYPEPVSGDFVVYRDYSWKEPTWVGFLRYDDSTWGAFVKTPSSRSDVRVLFRAELSDGELVLTGQNIISTITQDDVPAVNYLMEMLPSLVSWRGAASRDGAVVPPDGTVPGSALSPTGKRSALLPPCVSLALKRVEFGGDVTLLFAPEVPVFNLASMRGSGSGQMIELVRSGRVRSGGDAAFFGFVPGVQAKPGAALAVPSKRAVEKRTVDGIELALDGQWTMVADNTFFLGNSAVVIVDTLDLGLMQIPRDNLALSLTRLFSLSSASSWVDPAALSLAGTAKRFRIESSVYDAESGTVNRDIKLCVPQADGKKCAIATLSVNETAYRANKDYFDSIF